MSHRAASKVSHVSRLVGNFYKQPSRPSSERGLGRTKRFRTQAQLTAEIAQLRPEITAVNILLLDTLIFDVATLKYVREKYHLAGVLTGVLPQFPQQNIFGGLPLQLLPEELKYLADTKEFEFRDGRSAHIQQEVQEFGTEDANYVTVPASSTYLDQEKNLVKWTEPRPERYNIFRYLVQRGFFIMPGLRFGCQFMAYPGDLMRYHSHYNVIGFGWNEPFNVLDIVNGGRLATSVKKCWVVGAENPESKETEVFSIEWAQFG